MDSKKIYFTKVGKFPTHFPYSHKNLPQASSQMVKALVCRRSVVEKSSLAIVWMLTQYPPSNKCVSGDKTGGGGVKRAKKQMGHSTSSILMACGLLYSRHSAMYAIVYGANLYINNNTSQNSLTIQHTMLVPPFFAFSLALKTLLLGCQSWYYT